GDRPPTSAVVFFFPGVSAKIPQADRESRLIARACRAASLAALKFPCFKFVSALLSQRDSCHALTSFGPMVNTINPRANPAITARTIRPPRTEEERVWPARATLFFRLRACGVPGWLIGCVFV